MIARTSRWILVLLEAAPFISVAIAMVVPHLLPHDPAHATISGPDPQLVVKAVQDLPYRFGSWVGEDVAMPESAVRLLRPNAALSRRYRDLQSSASVDFVFVHCGDARDMLGHYPPICYPNSGWVFTHDSGDAGRQPRGSQVELMLTDRPLLVEMYEFSRMQTFSDQRHIRILNFFILPDGATAPDIAAINKGSSWLGSSIQGVAQVQMVTSAELTLDEAIRSANEILQGSKDLFEKLGVINHE